MKKSLLYWLTAVCIALGWSASVTAAENLVTSRFSSVELSATPLLSRSLSDISAGSVVAADVPSGVVRDAGYGYAGESHGFSWLLNTLIEPLYLTLLGAGLLFLGTFKRRGTD